MEYSITFLARGVWGSFPMVTMSGPDWTIFSTSRRILRRSISRFLRTLAATPEPSFTRPRRMCSVPIYSWLKRWASWLASCITLRARSVKRSYIPAIYDHPLPRSAVSGCGSVYVGRNANDPEARDVSPRHCQHSILTFAIPKGEPPRWDQSAERPV